MEELWVVEEGKREKLWFVEEGKREELWVVDLSMGRCLESAVDLGLFCACFLIDFDIVRLFSKQKGG